MWRLTHKIREHRSAATAMMRKQRAAEEMTASKKQREEAKTLADLQSAKLAELERQQSLHSPLGVLNNNSLNQQPPGLSMGSVGIPPGTANILPTSGNMGSYACTNTSALAFAHSTFGQSNVEAIYQRQLHQAELTMARQQSQVISFLSGARYNIG